MEEKEYIYKRKKNWRNMDRREGGEKETRKRSLAVKTGEGWEGKMEWRVCVRRGTMVRQREEEEGKKFKD